METKEMKAIISCKMRKGMQNALIVYEGFILIMGILGFAVDIDQGKVVGLPFYDELEFFHLNWWFFLPIKDYGNSSRNLGWSDFHAENLFLVIFMILFLMAIPAIALLIANRRRKLTELAASEKEIVGSYTSFIPISKLSLKMPVDKIDNITVADSKLYWFTGKKIRISFTSSIIRIPYALNADEIVAFLTEAIEKAKERKRIAAEKQVEQPQGIDGVNILKKIAELRDSGIITEEEFEQKKKEILEKM